MTSAVRDRYTPISTTVEIAKCLSLALFRKFYLEFMRPSHNALHLARPFVCQSVYPGRLSS